MSETRINLKSGEFYDAKECLCRILPLVLIAGDQELARGILQPGLKEDALPHMPVVVRNGDIPFAPGKVNHPAVLGHEGHITFDETWRKGLFADRRILVNVGKNAVELVR